MELWGFSLLLLAMLSVNQAQQKRRRLREMDPLLGETQRFPSAPGAGPYQVGSWDCPFLPLLWALLVALPGCVALYVLCFRGRGGAVLGSKPDTQSEEAFLRDVFTVLSLIREQLSQIAQDKRRHRRPLHKSSAEAS